MEVYQYEIINIFNNNFICNDVRKILKLYEKDISFINIFENKNLKEEIYKHPLFKNYNYCMFCREKAKTKYYSKNLRKSHFQLEEKTIGKYLLKNKIKLREIRNKKIKIAMRRFIHSYEKKNTNKNKAIIINSESDTELYIENNIKLKKYTRNYSQNIITNVDNKKVAFTNLDRIKTLKKSLSNEYKDKKSKKSNYSNNNIHYITPKDKNSLINKSTERRINLDEYDNLEKQININKIQLNVDNQDEIKTDINIDGESIINNNCFIDINDNEFNEFKRQKTKTSSKSKKKANNSKSLLQTINLNSNTKLNDDKNKNKEKNKIKNDELISSSKEEEETEEDKISHKSNQILEVTKKFLGLGRRSSLGRSNLRKNSISKAFEEQNKNELFGRNQTVKTYKENKKNKKNFTERNDNCSICLQEIKEKFTLLCGDFFCRDCIRNLILEAMKKISNLDKLQCPLCTDLIEKNTIKKLLTEEEFQKHQVLITRIEGLRNKNKDNIPCPYPDCPGWAKNHLNDNNIVNCQYAHTFCKKCQNIVDSTFGQNNKHKCNENITHEEEQTLQFLKDNKKYRKCPNCQSLVVREGGGCNNMTCTNVWCGYEFCWICNRKYEDSHYRNPLSMCFGLSEMNYEGKLAKYSRVRFFRCMLIFMLIIFVILPVIIVFFSVFEICLFIISFVLDGSFMKNIKLRSLYTHKFFYKIVYAFFIAIGIAYIPVGYMSLVIFSIFAPVVCIINKIRKNDEEVE